MVEVLEAAVRLLIVFAAFLTLPLLVGQLEHKVMAHMQARVGTDVRRWVPRVGPAGG